MLTDFYTFIMRFLKAMGFDFVYSQGFNPMPKVTFLSPGSVGIESYNDIMYFKAYNTFADKEKLLDALNRWAPNGLRFKTITSVENFKQFKKNVPVWATYHVQTLNPSDSFGETVMEAIREKLADNTYEFVEQTPQRLVVRLLISASFKNFIKAIPFGIKVERNLEIHGDI